MEYLAGELEKPTPKAARAQNSLSEFSVSGRHSKSWGRSFSPDLTSTLK
jgi:hypothetical protein